MSYGARVAERLYIVDGHGYIFRAHYGLMNISRGERKEVRLSTQDGMPTGALYVFTRMLMRMEEDNVPERMVVVFDDKSGRKTFRAEMYPEYKATRKAPPEELTVQMEYFDKIVNEMGWPTMAIPGVEADDVIATLVRQARARDWEVVKGPPEIVAAHAALVETTELNFIGNVEGMDIPRGVADVVVTGGFTGNVVLKMLEGVSETVVRLARYAHKERLAWRLGLMALSSAIDQLKEITDWHQYGGAPLLGFAHPLIKAHGRSNARAITNAIRVAEKVLSGNLTASIARTMAELDERKQKR